MLALFLGDNWFGEFALGLALWSGVILLLTSVFSFYQGWNQRRFPSLINETPRSDIARVRSSGTTRVRGEILPQKAHETFTSPFKGVENCVLSAWEIQERDNTPKTKSWERVAWGVHAVLFYLADGTGKILVDIDDEVVGNETDDVFTPETTLTSEGVSIEGLRCEFETFNVQVETDYAESPPRHVARFVENTDGISVDPMATGRSDIDVDRSKRKYLEQTLNQVTKLALLAL